MQSVTCLTADSGVASLIPAQSHTFVEADPEIISMAILLHSADSFKKGCVSYKRKYVHKLLVNGLFKLAQETGMRKFWIDQDFLIEHWHMMCIMSM